MKKVLFVFALALSCYGQTPCIDQAKVGTVGKCLGQKSIGTDKDAKFVSTSTEPNYKVDPTLPKSVSFEMSTFEQAQAMKTLLLFQYPGSALEITDYSGNFSYGLRKLQYVNVGGPTDPRFYALRGSINLPGQGNVPLTISVGWTINVIRLLYGGSYDTQELGYPYGNSLLVVYFGLGSGQAGWVGGPKQ